MKFLMVFHPPPVGKPMTGVMRKASEIPYNNFSITELEKALNP